MNAIAAGSEQKPLTQKDMKSITEDVNKALSAIGGNYGIVLSAAVASLSKRGKVNMVVKGGQGESNRPLKARILARRKQGETLPAYRLRVHHKDVGLSMDILGTNIEHSNKRWEVMGLRGKAHRVLLNCKDGSSMEMDTSDFTQMVDLAKSA